MFMIFNRDKIKSYLVSLGTVILLFIMCFSITNNDSNIIKTSGNAYTANKMQDSTNTKNEINNTDNN